MVNQLRKLAGAEGEDPEIVQAFVELSIERLEKLDGTADDLDDAIATLDALATTARWDLVEDDLAGDEQSDAFIENIADPYRTMNRALGWAAQTDVDAAKIGVALRWATHSRILA